MPKQAEYRIVWEKLPNQYRLYHLTDFSYPLPSDERLRYWLLKADTFQFCSPTGDTLTLRKEAKQRGNGYWYAYKRVGKSVRKKYLGTVNGITLHLLEEIAAQFVGHTTEPPPQQPQTPPPPPPRPATLKFEKTLQSALQIYGFANIPVKKDLISKYRELSKLHHPDVGGIHENMVAVNLAFDYLKRFL